MKKLSDLTPTHKSLRPESKRHPISLRPGLKTWVKNHKRLTIIIAAALTLIIIAAILAICLLTNNKKATTEEISKPVEKIEPVRYYSPLTGRETTKAKTEAPVTAVMIENSPEARPQSGLTDAGVVFEAVAEGGITRFIALYQEAEPTLIGPVRSVRPYYLEWGLAFDPSVAHVGGSNDALDMIRSGNYGLDLDQFFNSGAYWRTKDRAAPHNVYTDFTHLNQLEEQKGKTASDFTGLPRVDLDKEKESAETETTSEATLQPETASIINVPVSTGQFAVRYEYDQESKTYKRFVGGKPHLNRALDKTEAQIAPDVVIAIHVNQGIAADRIHSTITTSGNGECYIFQNGTAEKGTWQKDSAKSQIEFLDENNKEIKLNRGQTWITAVATGKAITWQ